MTPEQLLLDLPDLASSDPNNMPEVPVYVIHWNAPEWCVRTVRSLRASQHLRISLTIIDNGGLSEEALAGLQGAEIISTGANIGYTGGANRAIEAWRTTSSPIAVIACHDVELHDEALSLLVRAVGQPGIGIAGLTTSGYRDTPTAPVPPCSLILDSVSWVTGAVMVLSRACVDAVGQFDERLGSYAEDVDYCWRAADTGWGIVAVPGLTARCLGQVAENSTLMTRVNALRLIRFRRGRIGFALRLIAEVGLTTADGLRCLSPALRRRSLRMMAAHRATFAELPLLWRRVDNDVLKWPA